MKIESNIPVPGKHLDRIRYPFDHMAPGDSFWVEQREGDEYGQKFRSAVAKRNNRNRDDKKFIVRRDGDGFRCWRVK